MPVYIGPNDPSLPSSNMLANDNGVTTGAISYAANCFVFSNDSNNSIASDLNLANDNSDDHSNISVASIPKTFAIDGTSNTVIYVEKYALLHCQWDQSPYVGG